MQNNSQDIAVFFGPGNATRIKKWIDKKYPPLAWHLLSIHLSQLAIAKNIDFFKISPQVEFDNEVLQQINFFLTSHYHTPLF